MLISKMIPGLFGGVSQQPPALRLDSQCEAMVNLMPAIADGIYKRNALERVAEPWTDGIIPANAKVHVIDRDANERYLVVFTGLDTADAIRVTDIDGTTKTVKYGYWDEDDNFTEDASGRAYIVSSDPENDIKALTIADYTFVVNRNIQCAMSGVLDTTNTYPSAIIYVKNAPARTTYEVYVNETVEGTATADATAPSSIAVAEALRLSLIANLTSDFSVVRDGSILLLWNKNGTDFSCYGRDSWGEQALVVIKERVKKLSDLPPSLPAQAGHVTHAIHLSNPWKLTNFEIKVNSISVSLVNIGGGYGYFPPEWWRDTVVNTHFPANLPAISANFAWFSPDPKTIYLWRTDDVPFTLSVTAQYNSQYYPTWFYAQDLGSANINPTIFVGGVDSDSNEGYYVRYNKISETGVNVTAQWIETTKDAQDNNFNDFTMPHKLIREGDGVFYFGPVPWESRKVGDNNSAPEPSFIGSTINDIFLHKSRLGFLSGDRIILTRSSGFFNFWPLSALEVIDSDPIDIAPSTADVAELYWAVPFHSDIVVFSDRDQFLVTAGEQVFSAKNVALEHQVSQKCSTMVKPIGLGANIYFAALSGNYARLMEYFVTQNAITNDINDVSAHAPVYVPATVNAIAGSPVFNIVFLWEKGTKNIYCYRYFWNGEQKAQSAWFKWTVPYNILGGGIFDNYLYLLLKDGNDFRLTKYNLEPEPVSGVLDYQPKLDGLAHVVSGTYYAGGNYTEWTKTYTDDTLMEALYDDDGTQVDIDSQSSTYIRAMGNQSSKGIYFGIPYTSTFELSEFGVDAPNVNVHNLYGRLQIRTFTISYKNTGTFIVQCTPYERPAYTKEFTNTNVQGNAIGPPALSSGAGRFFVLGKAAKMKLEVINSTPYPSTFLSAAWEGFYAVRNRSMG